MPEQPPAKKVVKRVVKKVPAEPTIRYGRPAAKPVSTGKIAAARNRSITNRDQPAKTTGPQQVRESTHKTTGSSKSPATQIAARKKAVQQRAAGGIGGARRKLVAARSDATGQIKRGADIVLEAFWSTVYAVKDWWLPQLKPVPASLITGALAGLLAAILGFIAVQIFEVVRGVAGGGGTWGSLTFVVVAFIAYAFGEWLLGQFGVPLARLTSILGVVLALVAILSLFLSLADSQWATIVVPLSAAGGFAISHWLLSIAEASAADPQ